MCPFSAAKLIPHFFPRVVFRPKTVRAVPITQGFLSSLLFCTRSPEKLNTKIESIVLLIVLTLCVLFRAPFSRVDGRYDITRLYRWSSLTSCEGGSRRSRRAGEPSLKKMPTKINHLARALIFFCSVFEAARSALIYRTWYLIVGSYW